MMMSLTPLITLICILVFISEFENTSAENYAEDKSWEHENNKDVLSMPKITHLEVKCSKKHMTVHMSFSGYFNGIIYSKGGYSEEKCAYVHPNSHSKSVHFNIYYDSCGTNSDLHGKYFENTVIIQYQPDIIEAWDEARKIKCEWHDYYEKSAVKPSIKVADLEVVQQEFMGDKIGCWLEIQAGKGPWAKQVSGMVKIGQHMTMVVAVTDEYGQFDMRVKSCFAHDGSRYKSPLYLTDEHGCILRPKLMSPFKKVKVDEGRATVISYAYFSAFKFPDKVDVQIECKVEVCRYGCPEHCEKDGYKKPKVEENYGHDQYEQNVAVNYPQTPDFNDHNEVNHHEYSEESIKTENHVPHGNDVIEHSDDLAHKQQADVGFKIQFEPPKETYPDIDHSVPQQVIHEQLDHVENIPHLDIVPQIHDQPTFIDAQVHHSQESYQPTIEQDYTIHETEPQQNYEIVLEQPVDQYDQLASSGLSVVHNVQESIENYDHQKLNEVIIPEVSNNERPHFEQDLPSNDRRPPQHLEEHHAIRPVQEHKPDDQHRPHNNRPDDHHPHNNRPDDQHRPHNNRPDDQHHPHDRPNDQHRPHNNRPEDQRRPHNNRPEDQRRPHNNRPEDQHHPHNRPNDQHHPHNRPSDQHRPHNNRPGGQHRPNIDRPIHNSRRPPHQRPDNFVPPPPNRRRPPPNHRNPENRFPPEHNLHPPHRQHGGDRNRPPPRPSHHDRRNRLRRPHNRENEVFHQNPRFSDQDRHRVNHEKTVSRPNHKNEHEQKFSSSNFENVQIPAVFPEPSGDYSQSSPIIGDLTHAASFIQEKVESPNHQQFVQPLELPQQPPASYEQRPHNKDRHYAENRKDIKGGGSESRGSEIPKGPRFIHKRSADRDTAAQQLTVLGVSKAFQVLSENDIADDSNVLIVPDTRHFQKFRSESEGVCLPLTGFIAGTVLLLILIIVSVIITAVLYHRIPNKVRRYPKTRSEISQQHFDHYSIKTMSKRVL